MVIISSKVVNFSICIFYISSDDMIKSDIIIPVALVELGRANDLPGSGASVNEGDTPRTFWHAPTRPSGPMASPSFCVPLLAPLHSWHRNLYARKFGGPRHITSRRMQNRNEFCQLSHHSFKVPGKFRTIG